MLSKHVGNHSFHIMGCAETLTNFEPLLSFYFSCPKESFNGSLLFKSV